MLKFTIPGGWIEVPERKAEEPVPEPVQPEPVKQPTPAPVKPAPTQKGRL